MGLLLTWLLNAKPPSYTLDRSPLNPLPQDEGRQTKETRWLGRPGRSRQFWSLSWKAIHALGLTSLSALFTWCGVVYVCGTPAWTYARAHSHVCYFRSRTQQRGSYGSPGVVTTNYEKPDLRCPFYLILQKPCIPTKPSRGLLWSWKGSVNMETAVPEGVGWHPNERAMSCRGNPRLMALWWKYSF